MTRLLFSFVSFGLLCAVGACGGASATDVFAEDASTSDDGRAPPPDGGAGDSAHPGVDASSADAGRDGAGRDGAVTGDAGSCDRAPSGNACVACCASAHQGGKSELDLIGFNCMCRECSASCRASTCQANSPPQSPCIACVKASLVADCPGDGAWGQCSLSCKAYVECLERCAD